MNSRSLPLSQFQILSESEEFNEAVMYGARDSGGSKGKGNFCAIPACPGWVQGVDFSEDTRFVSFQPLTCQHHTALGRTGVYG